MRIRKPEKRKLLAGLLCLISVYGIGNTAAYFTENAAVTNVFTTGNLEIALEEPSWDSDEKDGRDMYPGYSVKKDPTVKNVTPDKNGKEPCYIRMCVEILDESGSEIGDEKALSLIYQTIYYDPSFEGGEKNGEKGITEGRVPGYRLEELNGYSMVNPLWEKDTIRSTAGKLIYNYKGLDGSGILDTGEQSTLFTDIVIPTDWGYEDIKRIGAFQLKITAEAIQSTDFATSKDAFRALDEKIREEMP